MFMAKALEHRGSVFPLVMRVYWRGRHWRRLLISHTQIGQVSLSVDTGSCDSSLGRTEEQGHG